MRLKSVVALAAVSASALALTACGGMAQAVGLKKVVPDEFLTVSSAPLQVPPEYGLIPPAPGQPRPQDLAPDSAARQILLGERAAVTRSAGENALADAAGASRADPLARFDIDDEFGDLAHKEPSWADRIIGWIPGVGSNQSTVASTSQGAITIDAASEAARLQALTGGQAIVIQPRADRGFKLPGL